MSIVTGTGDEGTSGIIGGRVDKDDARLEAYGTVDELSAAIGLALASDGLNDGIRAELTAIGHWLFDLGSDLATPGAGTSPAKPALLGDYIATIESWVHREEAALPELRTFILAGGDVTAARLQLARAICRRAERRVVTLRRTLSGDEASAALVFLNRLSDLLFMYARRVNHDRGQGDIAWQKNTPAPE